MADMADRYARNRGAVGWSAGPEWNTQGSWRGLHNSLGKMASSLESIELQAIPKDYFEEHFVPDEIIAYCLDCSKILPYEVMCWKPDWMEAVISDPEAEPCGFKGHVIVLQLIFGLFDQAPPALVVFNRVSWALQHDGTYWVHWHEPAKLMNANFELDVLIAAARADHV